MTVGELIAQLQQLDPNLPILTWVQDYTYLHGVALISDEDVPDSESYQHRPIKRPFVIGYDEETKKDLVQWTQCAILMVDDNHGGFPDPTRVVDEAP